MLSRTQLINQYLDLSLNNTSENQSRADLLINQQAKYLYHRYFDNERVFFLTTVGTQTLTLTGSLTSSASSATLTSAWSYNSCQQLVVFSNGEQRSVFFTQNSASITWQPPLTSSATTSISCQGVQAYILPANVSKIKTDTITVGQLVYSPAPVQSIQEWTQLNALPYQSNIPAYFFIYNRQLSFWPIPSTSGEVITIYGQIQAADMTYSDYTTPGAFAESGMTVGSNLITGSSTTWASSFPTGVDLTYANIFLIASPPNGDGTAYQVQSFTDNTHLTLLTPAINAPNISGGTMNIGQYPLLSPDFHDTILYGALRIYFNSIVKDSEKFGLYDSLYKEKLQQMEFYLSTKSVNVDLSVTPTINNANLFPMNIG